MTRLLALIAAALALLTCVSVGTTVYALLAASPLAWAFAAGAGLLDVFKYLAWPHAANLRIAGRTHLSDLTMLAALLLALVSGWAVYDRVQEGLTSKVVVRESAELPAAQAALSTLNAEVTEAMRQAALLRERGMATQALVMERQTLDPLRQARAGAEDRLSKAVAAQKEQALKAGLPDPIRHLIALGFAVALELVPVLVFLGVEKAPSRVSLLDLPPAKNPPPMPAVPSPMPPFRNPPPKAVKVVTPAEYPPPPPEPAAEDPLIGALAKEVESLPPGSALNIKKFARSVGIGNSRAGEVFKAAAEAGLVIKTARGYTTAGEPA